MELKKAAIEDFLKLKKICVDAYAKNFYMHWNNNGLDGYLEKEFSDKRLKADLNNKNVEYYFVHRNENPVGFIKICNNNLSGFQLNKSVELEKFYILPEFQSLGIGKIALSKIVEKVKWKGKNLLFLYVIDTNKTAIAFYKKRGFRFRGTSRLDLPDFKEELKGMYQMVLEINP